MKTAFRTSPRLGIILPSGNRINHGQLLVKEGNTIMIKPRKLNSSVPKDPPNLARDGGKKNIVDAPIKPGMTRQTKGEPAAFHHGVTVDDLPNSAIIPDREKPVGFAMGTTDDQIKRAVNHPTAGQVLQAAARLGRKA
jgi:hypothetical protein